MEIYAGVLLLASLIYRAVVPLRGLELGTVSHGIGAKEGVLMAVRGPPNARSVDVAGETQRTQRGTIAVTHQDTRGKGKRGKGLGREGRRKKGLG